MVDNKNIIINLNDIEKNKDYQMFLDENKSDLNMLGGTNDEEYELTPQIDESIEIKEEIENDPINLEVSLPDEKLPDIDLLNIDRISQDLPEDGGDELNDILKKSTKEIDTNDIMILRLYVLRYGSIFHMFHYYTNIHY